MLVAVEAAPGINKDDTPLAAEGGWVDGDKVRFVRGRPQTIGGWDAVFGVSFDGIARGGHSWSDQSGRKYTAFGTASKLYALQSGSLYDITPDHSFGVLTDALSTQAGSPVVMVHHVAHSFSTGQTVTFSNQSVPAGGITLAGPYAITVSGPDDYTVTAVANASSNASAAGGNIDFRAALAPGLVDAIGEPGGFGTGEYGSGSYGSGFAATDLLPRVWSVDNFGDNLVALPRGGGLYEWQPDPAYAELLANGGFTSSVGWTQGTGWLITGGLATATAGAASDLVTSQPLVGGKFYEIAVNVTRTAGSIVLKTDVGTIGDASFAISRSGSYRRAFRAPPGVTQLVISKDAAFDGSIDDVSIKLYSRAYRIREAPARSDTMFVDPNRIVVLVGTSLFGEPYNQLAVRWCERENLTDWTPSTTNLSGQFLLAAGGRAVAGLATRQQNVIWTDAALYTMQFTGDTADVFSFRLAGRGCGLAGAMAKAEHNGVVFWRGRDNFFVFQGSAPQSIPCPVKRDMFENLVAGQDEKIACGVNPGFSEVWWFYPDERDGTGECSRYVAFDFESGNALQAWTVGTFDRTTWIPPGVNDHPVALGADGQVYLHERGESASGAPLISFLEGAFSDLDDGNNLAALRRIVPDFEGLKGAVSITVSLRAFPAAPEVIKGTYPVAPNTQKIDLRATARQIKWTIRGAATPSFWRLGAVRLDILKTGSQR